MSTRKLPVVNAPAAPPVPAVAADKQLLIDDPEIDSLTLAINYTCNSRCRFCFIERELDMQLADTPVTFLDRVFRENMSRGRLYSRLILSGAECTLRPDLPDIAHRARRIGGFERVQIQTNGRKLADKHYLWKLLAAGIDEYFVSIHAPTAELDAYLTRSPKSFEQMLAGIRNVREVGGTLISNTAVTRSNYQHLPELAKLLVREQISWCQFWAFIEYGDIGQHDEHVRFSEAAPHLREAVGILQDAGRRVSLSWFPECLLGDRADALHHHRATLLIHDEFSERAAAASTFSCPHQSSCSRFDKTCLGLHERYIEVFGDEAAALIPS